MTRNPESTSDKNKSFGIHCFLQNDTDDMNQNYNSVCQTKSGRKPEEIETREQIGMAHKKLNVDKTHTDSLRHGNLVPYLDYCDLSLV